MIKMTKNFKIARILTSSKTTRFSQNLDDVKLTFDDSNERAIYQLKVNNQGFFIYICPQSNIRLIQIDGHDQNIVRIEYVDVKLNKLFFTTKQSIKVQTLRDAPVKGIVQVKCPKPFIFKYKAYVNRFPELLVDHVHRIAITRISISND